MATEHRRNQDRQGRRQQSRATNARRQDGSRGRRDARRGRGTTGRAGRSSRQMRPERQTSGWVELVERGLVATGRGLATFVLAEAEALGALVRFVADAISSRRGTLRRRPSRLEARHVLLLAALVAVIALPVSGVRGCQARKAEEVRAAAAAEASKREAQQLASEVPHAALRIATTYIEPTSTPREEWGKGSMPYLYQIDPAYADEQYSNGPMRLQGCGPFALTMAYVDLTGDTSMGPVEMAAYSTKHGYSTDKNGTAWALMSDGVAGLGLSSESIPTSASSIRQALEAGKDVICVMGPGTFTRVGHYIALDGLDGTGNAIVHDSNSYARSQVTWSLDLIASEANAIWALSA